MQSCPVLAECAMLRTHPTRCAVFGWRAILHTSSRCPELSWRLYCTTPYAVSGHSPCAVSGTELACGV
eukprot:2636015-Rhodomonas_salina.3